MWFAFKNCIFDYREQHLKRNEFGEFGCDLLSKIVSLTIANNVFFVFKFCFFVVICFQKLYLWLSRTTNSNANNSRNMLWFAFKNCIFDYREQQIKARNKRKYCCDLLSKIVSLTIANNKGLITASTFSVVICFQKLYLWLSRTTSK